jgi:hypothetical protein
MPTSVGVPGCTALQQVLVQEQCGRVTNGLGWVMATPPRYSHNIAEEHPIGRCSTLIERYRVAPLEYHRCWSGDYLEMFRRGGCPPYVGPYPASLPCALMYPRLGRRRGG